MRRVKQRPDLDDVDPDQDFDRRVLGDSVGDLNRVVWVRVDRINQERALKQVSRFQVYTVYRNGAEQALQALSDQTDLKLSHDPAIIVLLQSVP